MSAPTASTETHRRFVTDDSPVDVAVLIVTYNSAGEIGSLLDSLRGEAATVSMRVVVADNSSTDGTLPFVQAYGDVIAVPTGGNLGYSGGINVAAAAAAGDARALLILNPDLRVRAGAVAALLDTLDRNPGAGIVAPRILDGAGLPSHSLFREPGLVRSLFDAVLGPLWASRPAPLSEWVRTPTAYESARAVDWVTGAAMLISADTAAAVGEWDERFFLYSEETDYCRRARDAGFEVRYEPAAVVEHSQGGSGSSFALDSLLAVNRVRYMSKHAPARAGLYRWVAVLGAALRARRSDSARASLIYLRDPRRWADLPAATWEGAGAPAAASIVIPAYNEGPVIERTLRRLAAPAASGAIDVHVVCNGCVDDTAQRARGFAGVRVTDLSVASKIAALNEGARTAVARPVLYLDADIELPSAAIPTLVRALSRPGILGGRPPFEYDTSGSSRIVRSYYRARMRIPSMSGSLWGAGIYAVNEAGATRIGDFPDVTADDVFVDTRIAPGEKAFPPAPPVLVRVPRTTGALVSVLSRARRGPSEQGIDDGRATATRLLGTIRGPVSLWDAAVYALLTLQARRRVSSAQPQGWERDESSRTAFMSVSSSG